MDNKKFTDLLKQAQSMQGKLQEAQKRIESLTIEGTAGAGMVKVVITGRHETKKVTIDEKLLSDPNQNTKEILEDLIRAAFNDAIHKAEKASREHMASLASGFQPPADDQE